MLLRNQNMLYMGMFLAKDVGFDACILMRRYIILLQKKYRLILTDRNLSGM